MNLSKMLMVVGVTLTALSCNPASDEGEKHYAPLKNPTKVNVEQIPFTSQANLTWQDNCDNETGYAVYIKKGTAEEKQIAELPADACEYAINEGLEQGVTYSVGVQAVSGGPMLSSQIVYKELVMFDYSQLPSPAFSSDVVYSPTSALFEYKITSSSTYPATDWGLCWAQGHTPTIEDSLEHGPKANVARLTQAITCASIDYGVTYKVRAYVTSSMGTTYSDEVEIKLANEPEAITFSWTRIEDSTLPEDIKLYKTSDQLNGRPINAWYAIADVTKGNVEFRMEFTTKAKTLEEFYAGETDKNYILTNAGYFNMTTGAIGDYYVDKGSVTPSTSTPTLRGTFGVDENQKPMAFWAARDDNYVTYFYNAPMGNIDGKNSYNVVSASYPSQAITGWTPYYAMSAGPLLVKDGKVMTDVTSEGGTLVRNYEIIASDIFTNAVTPDRTAVGYTEDGKIILFICDGRIADSKGAGIVELAQIMKGLGCVGAVNFDGGGSTAMTLNGERLNSLVTNTSGTKTENRKVGSVMGFYKKN